MARRTNSLLEMMDSPDLDVLRHPQPAPDSYVSMQGADGVGVPVEGSEIGVLVSPVSPFTRYNIDPAIWPQFRILVSWPAIQNTGTAAGQVGAHIIVQEKGLTGDNFVVEGDWSGTPPVPRLRTANLTVAMAAGDPARSVDWAPVPININPGFQISVSASIVIGTALMEGKSDLDIVAIIRRLDNNGAVDVPNGSQGSYRIPDAFQVIRGIGFVPIVVNSPQVEVNPF